MDNNHARKKIEKAARMLLLVEAPSSEISDDASQRADLLQGKIINLPIGETFLARKKEECMQMMFTTLPTLIGEEKERARVTLFDDVLIVEAV
jgi:hypothetical protein